MPVTIKNRFTNEPIATVEDTYDLREAVIRLVKQGVSLANADLSYANLSSADLRSANLSSADLRYADLSSADLSSADLRSADLSSIEADFLLILSHAAIEVPALITAIEQGRINGSCYSDGECGCLIGTLAIASGADPKNRSACEVVHGVKGDGGRPAEVLFASIKKGDTPETNPVAKIVHGWATEWLDRMQKAFGTVSA